MNIEGKGGFVVTLEHLHIVKIYNKTDVEKTLLPYFIHLLLKDFWMGLLLAHSSVINVSINLER